MTVSRERATFDDWTGGRPLSSLGTNTGSEPLPFQRWRPFKEAFAPELVAAAVRENPIPVSHCVDPFGGSGTTALAAQFCGIRPTTIEINPFLADLVIAKLETYDIDALVHDVGRVLRRTESGLPRDPLASMGPPTMVEPGMRDRWIFDRDVADRIGAFVAAIGSLENERHQRLLRVLLGGCLVGVSNVVTSGKGRRYRRGWRERRHFAQEVDASFRQAAALAISEIRRYARRPCLEYEVVLGDARQEASKLQPFELAVFSPPYPNSFDYTDVYNVELWALGYLRDWEDNRSLRKSTLSSHVQVLRDYAAPPSTSPTLSRALCQLEEQRSRLWSKWIPSMLGAYFTDLEMVLTGLARKLEDGGRIWMVVGDSRYAEIQIPTAVIAEEVARAIGLTVVRRAPVRSMRASPQQGGDSRLQETLLVLAG